MSEEVPVLDIRELPERGLKAVEVQGRPVLIAKIQNQLAAWVDRCPHAGAPLRIGRRCGEELTCARHGWTFNLLTGNSVPDDPAVRLTKVPLKVEGFCVSFLV